ncbi:MAG: CcdB family protein [Giesbergeria sp.]
MARFDIYPNPIEPDRADFPFVLEIQSDLLYQFAERVCVPLARPGAFPGMTERFNPAIAVGEQTVHLHPLGIAVFLQSELRQSCNSAKAQMLEMETALDMLLRGY